MNKMKVLLIDDVGVPPLLDTVRCLGQESSIEIYIASINKNHRNDLVKHSRYVKDYFSLPWSNDQDKIDQILTLVKRLNIQTILPIKEPTYKLFSKYITAFDGMNLPPINEPNILHTVVDKWLLHQWLESHELPTPQSYQATNSNLEKLNYPFLLKPRRGAGGNDIVPIQNPEMAHQKIIQKGVSAEDYIFQELITGEGIDISLIARDGKILAHTIQKGLIRKSYSYARGIQFLKNSDFLRQVEAIIEKLNWSGITHLDFMYSQNTGMYYLIDFNPRTWSTILGSLHSGVNFPLLLYKLAIGEEIQFNGYEDKPFYLNREAIKRLLTGIIRKGQSYSFKNSSLYYAMKDPLPEMLKPFESLSGIFSH